MSRHATETTGWKNVAHAMARAAVTPDRSPMTATKVIGWTLATIGAIALALFFSAVTP